MLCFFFPCHPLHQALGTGIASELDLAYWHARYTAASRFDAGCVTADPAASFHVVPPPEVYFVGLAFHVPSVAELRALTLSVALRSTLARVFDLPVSDADHEHEAAGLPSSGVHVYQFVRVCVFGAGFAVGGVAAGPNAACEEVLRWRRCKG